MREHNLYALQDCSAEYLRERLAEAHKQHLAKQATSGNMALWLSNVIGVAAGAAHSWRRFRPVAPALNA